jgi:hypothetical protein
MYNPFRLQSKIVLVVSFPIWRLVLTFAPVPSVTTKQFQWPKSAPLLCRYLIPNGRVEDMDAWIQLSSDSLQRFTGKSLFDYMEEGNITTPSQIHHNERYAVLSHGTQDDPIYCYFNRAALQQFQWTEEEVYSLASRYSAPDGADRTTRQADVQQALEDDVKELTSVVRQTKHGDLFEMVNVVLWNVYNGTQRVGQTAIYDRELVRPVEKTQPASGRNQQQQPRHEE